MEGGEFFEGTLDEVQSYFRRKKSRKKPQQEDASLNELPMDYLYMYMYVQKFKTQNNLLTTIFENLLKKQDIKKFKRLNTMEFKTKNTLLTTIFEEFKTQNTLLTTIFEEFKTQNTLLTTIFEKFMRKNKKKFMRKNKKEFKTQNTLLTTIFEKFKRCNIMKFKRLNTMKFIRQNKMEFKTQNTLLTTIFEKFKRRNIMKFKRLNTMKFIRQNKMKFKRLNTMKFNTQNNLLTTIFEKFKRRNIMEFKTQNTLLTTIFEKFKRHNIMKFKRLNTMEFKTQNTLLTTIFEKSKRLNTMKSKRLNTMKSKRLNTMNLKRQDIKKNDFKNIFGLTPGREYSYGAIKNGVQLFIQNSDVSSKKNDFKNIFGLTPDQYENHSFTKKDFPSSIKICAVLQKNNNDDVFGLPRGMFPYPKSPPDEKIGTSSGILIGSRGGVVCEDGVELVIPPKAVVRPLNVKITLENPSKWHGLIIEKNLENGVIFCAPIINLQPNGHFFKKPATLTFYLNIKHFDCHSVVILHGKEATDGKIYWLDITETSEINMKTAKVTTKLKGFSFITAFWKRPWIRTKEIFARLNLVAFDYTLAVLLDLNFNTLALLFVSRDVYIEEFYRESETSALVQLKAEGYRELPVRPVDECGERRICNHENIKVSVRLGEDYKLAHGHDNHSFTVESEVWWSTGCVIKLPLEGAKDVRILCGKISVEGESGHRGEGYFRELDLHGYVRGLLGVEGAIFNVIPFARALDIPTEAMDQVIKSCNDDDQQLEIILNHWSKEKDVPENPAALRKAAEGSKQDCRVTQRGQMHVKNLRSMSASISSGQQLSHVSSEVRTLCNMVLTDCCIELEKSPQGVERAASSTNHVVYPKVHRLLHVSECLQQITGSSSAEGITKSFLQIVPDLIQTIKEIFISEKNSNLQNGLRGLPHETNVRAAEKDNGVLKLIGGLSEVLQRLCLENRGKLHTTEIKKWGSSLAILPMLDFLKPFFQNCPEHVRLHERLELLAGNMKRIFTDSQQFADEVFRRDLTNLSISLIHFAKSKSNSSNLVRFELTERAHRWTNSSSEGRRPRPDTVGGYPVPSYSAYTVPVTEEAVVSVRPVYKLGSEAINHDVNSNDFEALPDSSAEGARITEGQLVVKEGRPSYEELQGLSERIGDGWKKLGRRLKPKFEEEMLTSFHKENEELSEKVYAMLIAWKRRASSDATYLVLYEALCDSYVGRKDLAEEVCCYSG